MTLLRALCLFLLCAAPPLAAQDLDAPMRDTEFGRAEVAPDTEAATGGATLEDILRRQRGEILDPPRQAPELGGAAAQPVTDPLGTLGGASDPDLWRALRHDTADLNSSARGPATDVVMQDGGMWWLEVRQGPLATYGALLLAGMVLLLAVVFVVGGRMQVAGPKSGRTLTRFIGIERFAHWLLAGSFLILAVTGLVSLFGRKVLIPAFGHESFATLAAGSKWVHDNISWAFMLALVMVFALWVWDNLPDRTDLKWIAQGGGFFNDRHPAAKKFNFGQKVIFWSVIVLGASISVSGLSLLFPQELHLFAPSFDKLNAMGLPQMLGFAPIDTALAPQEEMQLAQLWHAIVGFVLMAIIIAHIYIGTVGMEGAFSAMGSGQVGEEWAEQHHSLWAARKTRTGRRGAGRATPAE